MKMVEIALDLRDASYDVVPMPFPTPFFSTPHNSRYTYFFLNVFVFASRPKEDRTTSTSKPVYTHIYVHKKFSSKEVFGDESR